MNNNRPLLPGFLRKLDRKWLLNTPELWTSRIHLVGYYGLLVLLTLALIASTVPDDPRVSSQAGVWVGFVSIVSAIGIVIWVIYLLRFNVFKRYGQTSPLNRLAVFLQYFVCIGIFVLFPYVKPIVETVRANSAYSKSEIFNDLNTINLSIAQLEYDSVDHRWSADTVNFSVSDLLNPGSAYSDESLDTAVPTPRRRRFATIQEFENFLRNADSLVKLDDTTWVNLTPPVYTPLSIYYHNRDNDSGAYKSADVYRAVIRNYRPPERVVLRRTVDSLTDKYAVMRTHLTYAFSPYYGYYDRLNARYFLGDISGAMENIMDRKHRFDADVLPAMIRLHFYLTLCLCLLLFAFRHSTVRSFFFGLLAGFILMILTLLSRAFYGFESGYYGWIHHIFITTLTIVALTFIVS